MRDYLERKQAFATHIAAIRATLAQPFAAPRYAANKNEAQLRLEFAQYGLLVAPAESNQMAGIQRVHAWLAAKQLWFVAASAGGDGQNAERTIRQMSSYRYADNRLTDGSKREKELVVKLNDELCDCVRYDLQTFPALPKLPDATGRRDLSLLSERDRADIERMREFDARQEAKELKLGDKGWPFSEMFGEAVESDAW